MHLSWDDPFMIRPEFRSDKRPTLQIPGDLQKNATEEEIPLLPGFERVLMETPVKDRVGWIFEPQVRRPPRAGDSQPDRLSSKHVGRVISKIGKAVGVVVTPADINESTSQIRQRPRPTTVTGSAYARRERTAPLISRVLLTRQLGDYPEALCTRQY